MQGYIIRRLLLIVPTLLLVTVIVFFLLRFIPGDIVDVMEAEQVAYGTDEALDREAILKHLGLDTPLHIQYIRWLGNVLSGSFGQSLWSNKSVLDLMKDRIPISFELGILGLLIGQAVAIPVGVISAIRQDAPQDYIGRTLAIILMCVPNFWLGTLVMVYPAIWWRWSPSMVYIPLVEDPLGNLGMFIIPAIIVGVSASGSTMRMTRTMMLEVLRQDYIRTAWSKGLNERLTIVRHALKNALIPVVTMVGMQVPTVIGGTIIIEQIFNLPGMGRLMIEALNSRDYPVVSGINLFVAAFVLLCNLGVDLTYAYLDPRIRYR